MRGTKVPLVVWCFQNVWDLCDENNAGNRPCVLCLSVCSMFTFQTHIAANSHLKNVPVPTFKLLLRSFFLTTGKFDSNMFLKMEQMLAHNEHIKYLNEIGPSVSKSYIRSNELVFPLGRKENMLMVWLILTRLGYNNILQGQSSSIFKALNVIWNETWDADFGPRKVTYFYYCRGSISQSEILLLIKYFALDDNKTLHIFRLAQQDTPW